VYNALGVEPLHVDEISAEVDLPVEQVTSNLAMMDLKGMVKKIYGMKYMAVLEKQVEYEPGTKQD
jgi:predicted Rossmann fold nucleotide-binding protein DprA/Smf involved in DNA uptake